MNEKLTNLLLEAAALDLNYNIHLDELKKEYRNCLIDLIDQFFSDHNNRNIDRFKLLGSITNKILSYPESELFSQNVHIHNIKFDLINLCNKFIQEQYNDRLVSV